jgi:hypothetical protein
MGQILHGSATTTHAIRAAIQRSKATAKELAERHGINPKTVAKWKKRSFVLLADFLAAYNFAKRLKTLRGLTPDEYVCKCWTENPDQFRLNPLHHMPGLKI